MDVVITHGNNKKSNNFKGKIIYTSTKLIKLKWTMQNL
jgi:hypothetical protein